MSELSSRGAAWNKIRLQVLERDQWRCYYCGGEATEADHLLSKAEGGTDTLDNLVASCKEDNARKGARPLVRMNWFSNRWLSAL